MCDFFSIVCGKGVMADRNIYLLDHFLVSGGLLGTKQLIWQNIIERTVSIQWWSWSDTTWCNIYIPLRVFKWTSTFEMWFIPSWTNRFKPHQHTCHLSGLTSNSSNSVTCLLTFTWSWTRIAMKLSVQRSSSDKAYIFPSWHDYKTLIFKLP